MDFILKTLPKNAERISEGLWRIDGRRYARALAYDEETGEMSQPVYRDIRFELLDPTPLEIPVALKRPESTDQRIQRLMKLNREWERYAAWVDSGEDPDDFDFELPEDAQFTSKYQAFRDLSTEMRNITDEEVNEKMSKMGHNKGPKLENEEMFPENKKEPPKQSTKTVDKKAPDPEE